MPLPPPPAGPPGHCRAAAPSPGQGARWLRATELGLPLLALAVALALAVPPTAVPASLPVLAVLLLAGAGALVTVDRLPRFADGLLAAAFALAAEHRLMWGEGLVWGYDSRIHIWGASAIAAALREGHLPLWLHPLGTGIPLLQFYPPLGFLPVVASHLAGLPLDIAYRLGFAVFAVVAAVGAQRAVREWTGDRAAALVAGLALALAPYRLFNSHTRGALGETAAMAVLPFVWLAYERVVAGRGRAGGLAVPAAALATTHLLTTVIAAYATACWFAAAAAAKGRAALRLAGAAVPRLVAAAVVAAALAAAFLLPLAVDIDATSVHEIVARGASYPSPGVTPRDWLGVRRDPAEAESRPRPRAFARQFERLPVLPFGVALLAGLALLAVQAVSPTGRGRGGAPGSGSSLQWGLLAAAAFGLALSLEGSEDWALGLPGLRAIQFSWRGLGVATVAASLALGLAVARADAGRRRPLVALLFLVALVAEGRRHTGAERWLGPWREVSTIAHTGGGLFAATPLKRPPRRTSGQVVPPTQPPGGLATGLAEAYIEYSRPAVFARRRGAWQELGVALVARIDGRQVRLRARRYAEWLEVGKPPAAARAVASGGTITAITGGRQGTLVVREQCFPGWQQHTPAGWRPATCSPDGFLLARTAGESNVEWRFAAWRWPRLVGCGLSATTALVLAVTAVRRRRRPVWTC